MKMYFIALLAPENINAKILQWKYFFKEKYGCIVGLKSPAHITLVPPFWMKPESESALINSINEFSLNRTPFELKLKDFSSFKPKVIFVNIVANEMLDQLHQNFYDYIMAGNKFPIKKDERVFQPHITIATRDLYKKTYYEAWEIFSTKKYEAAWQINGISLLKHNSINWEVLYSSQFFR
jgi:2'-5' RNA ligase